MYIISNKKSLLDLLELFIEDKLFDKYRLFSECDLFTSL